MASAKRPVAKKTKPATTVAKKKPAARPGGSKYDQPGAPWWKKLM